MPTKDERDLKRLEKLQAEQKQLQAQLKKEKQTLQDLQNEKRRRKKNEVARAQSRVQANERKARTRRLIVTGGAVEAEAEAYTEVATWLRALLDRRLERDQDRALVGLDPLPTEMPEPEPALADGGEESVPLPGWEPARLPGGSWGSRHNDPAILPEDLVGRAIEITASNGDSWAATIERVVLSSETHVLVQDSARPDR